MSPKPDLDKLARAGFPRVSGDEPLKVIPDLKATAFSPRERG